ncbi:hypothetical protein DRN93_01225 [archaeon]|nr:MAG: hypothetical protein DRN93_01225 [archaeon]
MTYEEVIVRARERLDDVVKPYLWSSLELKQYLVEALDELLSETLIYSKSFKEIEVRGGSKYYKTPSYVIAIDEESVYFDETQLVLADRDDVIRGFRTPGSPLWYFFQDKKIYFFPYPKENGELSFEARCTIESIPDASEVVPIQPNYHFFLIYGIMARAFLKVDSETYNPQQAQKYDLLFKQKIEEIKKRKLREEYTIRQNPVHQGLL